MATCSWPLCSLGVDAKQTKLLGAVEQAFDRGRRPAGERANRRTPPPCARGRMANTPIAHGCRLSASP
jgi:hypothetical protein